MQYLNYRENMQRGSQDFPIAFYHVEGNHPQYIMALHWHVEFELIRVVSGSFFLTVDEESFRLEKGDAAFIPAGALHSGLPDSCIYECIVLDLNMLLNPKQSCVNLLWAILNNEIEPYHRIPGEETALQAPLNLLFDAVASKKEGYQLVAVGALYTFIGAVFSEGYYRPCVCKNAWLHKKVIQLKTALEFMEASYNTPLTLEEMAQSVHMSPKYFCRFFKEMTHQTPLGYLNYYRIERACYELLSTNKSVTEIAYDSGFNNLSHFIRIFKRYKGTTPKQYMSGPIIPLPQ